VLVERLHGSWPLLGLPRMATALFATLRPATGELRIASAGHLPPLLVADGRAQLLPVTPGRILGAPPGPAPEWSGRLPAGASLVLFTDGLVESRTADLDAGLDRLRAVAEEAAGEGPADPDVLCDRLLAALTGPRRADDVALLVLTRLGDAADGEPVVAEEPAAGHAAVPAAVPAPDRAAHSAADLADALDGAGGDVTVSGDAMRWSPEPAEPPAPPAGFPGLDVAAGLGMALGLDPASVRRLVSGALTRLSGAVGDAVGELRQLARDVRPGGDPGGDPDGDPDR
jgi:serine/threonine-protein kinase RsbW